MQSKIILALAATSQALEVPKLSMPSIKLPAVPSVAELQANPLQAAVPAAAAGLALCAAAATLTAPAHEKGSYDQYLALGLPGGAEKLIVGRPFQEDNGNLGLWTWVKTGGPALPKDYAPDVQARMKEQYYADMKKFDVEAQQEGYKNAEDRGIQKRQAKLDEEARIKAEKAAAKAAKAAAEAAAKEAAAKKAVEDAKPGTVTNPKYPTGTPATAAQVGAKKK